MNIALWIVFGAQIGWIGSMIIDPEQTKGTAASIVIAVFGAIAGGLIATFVCEGATIVDFNIYSILSAVCGAVLMVFVWSLVESR